jgi:hypothetical protein
MLNKIKTLYKYENITDEDIKEIDEFIELNIKYKKKYIQCKENELLKIIDYINQEYPDINPMKSNQLIANIYYNPNIDLDYIKKLNPSEHFYYQYISENPNITIKDIFTLKKSWNWHALSSNSGITIKDIVDNNYNRDMITNNFNYYSKHLMQKNFNEMPTTWWQFNYAIKLNKNITIQHIIYYNWNLDGHDISTNKFIDMEYISKNMNKVNLNLISCNPNITIDFVLKNIDKRFYWNGLSANPNITMKNIEDNLHLPWDWSFVSKNPNITIDFIRKYNNYKSCIWNWNHISSNVGITMKDIENNFDLPWSWLDILYNPNLTLDFIKKYKRKIFTIERKTIISRINTIFTNEFIHNEFLCNKMISAEINEVKTNTNNVLNKYINTDFIKILNTYSYYN